MKHLLPILCLALLAACSSHTEQEQQAALDFLYTYMPRPDSVDYDRAFWVRNVEASLQARREMPWGAKVPDREWRHFVLPVRVNNERLDSSRWVFYDALKERVRHLSMAEAILEVNHWCHEHVTYTPSDERTSSPLATLRTATGRCGEESTFTVAALRAVGIPARQVYTPRWAHTDDNHAWVEAWADGQWHFLGACEPEAVLDLGWFNAPASRGMLMHTKVFGAYNGPEEQVSQNECYTEINVTKNYAPVGQAWVRVVDEAGRPVENAVVAFKVYNYAEFYTVATKQTDIHGVASLEAGKGDLVAWAQHADRYGVALCSVAKGDTTLLTLSHSAGEAWCMDLDIVPPVERNTIPQQTDEQKARNAERLAYEDSVRMAYTATFSNESPLLAKSRGNHATIQQFLEQTHANDRAMDLLSAISDKDLRDIDLATLMDAYEHTPADATLPRDFYARYVLSPRVANEMVLPHRELLSQALKGDVATLKQWVKEHIVCTPMRNPQQLRMTPEGVWQSRMTDARSRDIFFVAACRSNGLPARIDPVTGKLQVADATCKWTDVVWETVVESNAPKGLLQANYQPSLVLPNPRYYSHFSLSRLVDGLPVLQNYGEEDSYESLLQKGIEVEQGDYVLITGTRMASGKVLAHMEVFPVQERAVVPLTMRTDEEDLSVIGSLNSENLYTSLADGKVGSLLSTTGRGYYIIGMIAPNNEPTNHVLRDMAARKAELEAWGRTIVLLFPSQADADRFRLSDFPSLPPNVVFGIDHTGAIAREMPGTLPVVKIADTFNRVVFSSQGYTIGMGEQLLKATSRL